MCSVSHSHEVIGTQIGTCVENSEYVVILLLRATIDSGACTDFKHCKKYALKSQVRLKTRENYPRPSNSRPLIAIKLRYKFIYGAKVGQNG